jgi:hypothetical protein
MTYDTARKLLTNAFLAAWGTPGDFAVTFENQKFSIPESDTWGRWSVQFGQPGQQSLGNSFTRVRGIAYLQVFIPEGKGAAPANKAAEKLGAAMNRAILREGITHVNCEIVGVQEAGTAEGRVQKNVWLPFYVDHNPAA